MEEQNNTGILLYEDEGKRKYVGLLAVLFYIRFVEKYNNKKINVDAFLSRKRILKFWEKDSEFKKLFKKVQKEIERFEGKTDSLGGINPKHGSIVESSFEIELKERGELTEAFIESFLNQYSHLDVDLINNLIEIRNLRGIKSRNEKNILKRFVGKVGFSKEETKNIQSRLKIKRSKGERFSLFSIIILIMFVVAFCISVLTINAIEKKKMSQFNVEKYIEDNPKLVFKRIEFRKFLIHGKPDGTNEHWDKLNIIHLQGYADLYIELNNLKVLEEKTDFLNKSIYLQYKSPTVFPVSVDITIPSGDYTPVESISGKNFTEEEAEEISKYIGGFAAVAGLASGAATANATTEKLHGTKKLAAVGVGAVSGAILSGIFSYIGSKNFLMKLPLSENNSSSEVDELMKRAKVILANEIMGGDLLSEADPRTSLQKYYQEECEKQIKDLFHSIGWSHVDISFIYPK